MLTECEVEGLVRAKMEMEIKWSDGRQQSNSDTDRGGCEKVTGVLEQNDHAPVKGGITALGMYISHVNFLQNQEQTGNKLEPEPRNAIQSQQPRCY